MRPSEQSLRDGRRVRAFRDAYIALLNTSKRVDDFPHEKLVPTGDRQAWLNLRHDLARLAGAATESYARLDGGIIAISGAAVAGARIHPMANWDISIDKPDVLDPRLVLSAVEAVVGTAEQRYEDSLERERGVLGLLAAFVRWPQTLREAVGDSRSQRAVATTLGVVGQLVVATLSTALASGIVALVTWIWQMVTSH